MDVRSHRFTVIVTLSALFVGLARLVGSILTQANYSRLVVGADEFSRYAIIELRAVTSGAMLAGLCILTAVLTAAALSRPGRWRWPVLLGFLSLMTVVVAADEIFSFSATFTDGTPTLDLLPLVAVWLPGLALVVARGRRRPPPDSPQLPGPSAGAAVRGVSALLAVGVTGLVLVVVATTSGDLLHGAPLLVPVTLPHATIVCVTIAAWITASGPRATLAWLLAAGLLATFAQVTTYGTTFAPVPAVAVGAITLARFRPQVLAWVLRRVPVRPSL